MRLIRYKPEYQESMLTLHRSAIEGFTLGMSQQEDEADLVAVEEVYLRSRGEFLLGFIGQRLVAMGGFKWLSHRLAELRRMRIVSDLQGRGYGTRLLQELERRAFESGIWRACSARPSVAGAVPMENPCSMCAAGGTHLMRDAATSLRWRCPLKRRH